MIAFDREAFVRDLNACRGGASWRWLAREAGVSPSTLTRLRQGKNPDIDTFGRLVVWMGSSARRYFVERGRAVT